MTSIGIIGTGQVAGALATALAKAGHDVVLGSRTPGVLPEATTVFLSGDDPHAKERVARLLDDLGWPPATRLDLGDLRTARGQEHLAPLLLAIGAATGSYTFGLRLVTPPDRTVTSTPA
ncbi:NAD(P)-binding domain-containing protein [Streptomyces sp. JNUCC 64]